jgi:hypothetical protein
VLVQQLASRFAVELRLQQAFPRRHGDIPNGAVLKISGNGDKPAWLFRRFKEDSFPSGCRFSRARSIWHRADAAVAAAGVAADARAVRAGVRGQP